MSINERGSPVPAGRASKSKHLPSKLTLPARRSSTLPEGYFEVEEGTRVFVPPGIYNVALADWSTRIMFGKAKKLALTFRIIDMGEHFGVFVVRWYNVIKLKGPPGLHGQFRVSKGSNFLADYVRLLGMPLRLDRVSLSQLFPLVIRARIGTVTANRVQAAIAEPLRYSVIRELIGIEAGTLQ